MASPTAMSHPRRELAETDPRDALPANPALTPAGSRLISGIERAERGYRKANTASENAALHSLADCLDGRPLEVLERLVKIAVDLADGEDGDFSAGVSLMQRDSAGKPFFRWVAMHGPLSNETGRITPRFFSPCGECLNRGDSVQYARPDLKFKYLQETNIEMSELLVVPFAPERGALTVGTLWIVSHPQATRGLDSEDERILKRMSAFASRIYTLTSARNIDPESELSDAVFYKAPSSMRIFANVIKVLPRTAGISALAGSLIVLAGWALNVPLMKSLFVPGVTIKPNTALGILLSAAGLLLLPLRYRRSHLRTRISAFLFGLVVLIGLATLAEYIFGTSTGIDRLLFAGSVPLAETIPKLRMAAVTAICLAMMGGGFLLGTTGGKRFSWYANGILALTSAVALTSILWYAYGAIPLAGTGQGLQIALPTAALIFAICLGGIFVRQDTNFLRSVLADRAGGILAARALPYVFIIPFLLGLLRTRAINTESESLEAAVIASLTMLAFAVLVWRSSDTLNRIDERKEELDRDSSRLLRLAEGERARAESAIATRVVTETAYKELHEATLRHHSTEAFLSAAMSSSPAGFVFWDSDLRIIRVSHLVASWSHRNAEEFVGKTMEEAAPYLAQIVNPVVREVFETRTPVANVRIYRPGSISDGIDRHLNAMFYPVLTETNEMIGVGAVLVDVTQEFARERALQESNERFRMVAKATNDAVWDLDLAAGRVVWSDALQTVFGYEREDMITTSEWWVSKIHEEDRASVMENFRSAVAGTDQQWSVSYRVQRADGSYARVIDRAYIIRDADGKARRVIGAVTDRTHQEALESRHRYLQKMDAVGRLSAGVAHDFNNVLAVVSLSAESLLSELEPGDSYYEEILEIKKAAERGGRLTRQLLAFTRQQMASPVALDLNESLDEMMGMLARLVPTDVEIVSQQAEDLAMARIDRGQLEQIAMNLVVNACDAMPDGGTLRIATGNFSGLVPCEGGVKGQFVTLTVSDTGTGMSEETLSRIFDPFFTTKDIGRGTGLGLATVHGIVKQSGGEICVSSRLGEGSKFTIFLPVMGDDAAAESGRPAVEANVTGEHPVGGHTILLVEDDESLRKSIGRILERAGYRVLIAHNGAEALQVGHAHKGRIDLVLSDARMPVMGGAELVRRISADRIDTKVLVMSGYTDEIESRVLRNEETPFIEKPFTPAALLERVRSIIGA